MANANTPQSDNLRFAAKEALGRMEDRGERNEDLETAANIVAEDYADVTAEQIVAYLRGEL